MATKNNIEVKKNEFLRQFEALVDNELIAIEFAEQENRIFLTKLVVSEHLADEGYDTLLIKTVLDLFLDSKTKIVPTCKEVKSFMRRNKMKYQKLLPVGIAL
jgi:predicted GNAT family acetyltransferase